MNTRKGIIKIVVPVRVSGQIVADEVSDEELPNGSEVPKIFRKFKGKLLI